MEKEYSIQEPNREWNFETISECKWLSTTWIHTRIEKWWINSWHLKYSRNPLDAHKSSTVFSNTFCYFAFDYLRCSRFFARISISHETFFAVFGGSVHLFVITISFIIWADAATAAAVAAAWCLLCVDFGYLRSTCQYNAHVIKNIISSILICALFEAWFFESAILSHTHTQLQSLRFNIQANKYTNIGCGWNVRGSIKVTGKKRRAKWNDREKNLWKRFSYNIFNILYIICIFLPHHNMHCHRNACFIAHTIAKYPGKNHFFSVGFVRFVHRYLTCRAWSVPNTCI